MNRVSSYTEMRNVAACDAHFKKLLNKVRNGRQWGRGEYRTFIVTEAPPPSETLTARPLAHGFWGYDDLPPGSYFRPD